MGNRLLGVMLTLSFFCEGLTGSCLTFRKPSPGDRRLNEASQPAESNLSTSILKRLAGKQTCQQALRIEEKSALPSVFDLLVRNAGRYVDPRASREDRLLSGCHLAGVEASRMVPTLGSDFHALWNGRSSLNGTLNGFVLVKRLKRIKLERWH